MSVCLSVYLCLYVWCNRHLPDVEVTLESMLKPRVATLPGHIQGVYVQNICKLYGRVLAKAELNNDDELVQRSSRLVSDHLSLFVHSADLEVQERVSTSCNSNSIVIVVVVVVVVVAAAAVAVAVVLVVFVIVVVVVVVVVGGGGAAGNKITQQLLL